ncbi:uncharacterized protein LOC132036021 [Lycium ferocissimum]|uniref:uncharacterized protein LOC132036021 n=1 Tax=Lycium ferocissimum TaxID=112874 RepID=UPI002815ECDD|nr:uncharacterized protein LOC132036021 [Lycium ferocissimum]
MDLSDEMSVPTSPKTPTTKNDQMEPGVLLEESWFFGNLLDRKSRMLRCYSDPCPKNTQEFSAGKSMEETFSSLQKLPHGEKLNLDSRKSKPRLQRASSSASSSQSSNLHRVPSLPVFVDYKEEPHDEESDFSMGKLIRQASINQVKISPQKHISKSNLQRAPSLPVFQESEQVHDQESDFSMGKLIRQASINQVKISPQKHTSKSNLQRAPSLPVFQESEQVHDQESDFSMGKLIRQASINQVKISPQKHTQSTLQRVPSLPVFQESEQVHDEESDFSMGKLIRQASINKVKVSPQKQTSQVLLPKGNLQRAPSLPAFAKMEEIHEEENEFPMGKLIRQASLNHARVLPPKHTSKGLTRSPSISSTTKHRLRRKQDQESRLRNSSTGLEVEDLQGFKNLELNNEKKDSIPKFANTSTPGLEEQNEKKPVGLSELDEIRTPPYYSPEDQMKEQIKFWARAVASNVR